jgi:hypothetical protein
MGGMECFKRQGRGIVFMDSGACALVQYSNDVMVGHNIILRDGSLTSVVVWGNRSKSVCFRSGSHLLHLGFSNDNKM